MLDNIQETTTIIFTVFLVLIVLFIIIMVFYKLADDYDENNKEIKYFAKQIYHLIIVAAILMGITCFIPNTKQAAAIYFVPKVINNKQIRKMPDKLVTLANAWMNEQIKSVKGKK
jgi:quinol-cytochrome oxidoreductase complex cytochrome b subunit